MDPRLRLCPACLHPIRRRPLQHRHLATATAITPAAPIYQTINAPPPITRYPPTQPPSHKPPEYRKSQLHRQYTSLLRSTPLMLLFQHNNLKATEWMHIRRELDSALRKVDANLSTSLAPHIKTQSIQTGIFESALLVTEYYNPSLAPPGPTAHSKSPSSQSSAPASNINPSPTDPHLNHYLSRDAHSTAIRHRKRHPLLPLLSGPLALLTFPTVSPPHLHAALCILSPRASSFPAPSRRSNPGYHDPSVQAGLQKLMLLGARVEGRVFDGEEARWVAGIEGGMEGLRGRLVEILEGVGAGIVGGLERVGRSLWVVVEGRRGLLEEEAKGREERKGGEKE